MARTWCTNMMKQAHGQVTVNEVPGKSKLSKFCEKKIDQWLESHPTPLSSTAEFKVSFTQDEEAKQVSCVTEIQVGDLMLRGADMDADSQAAFLHSLKRLHQTSMERVQAIL